MTANSSEKQIAIPLDLYSYVLEEYPAQLIQYHYWQDIKSDTEKKWSKYLQFLRWRKHDVKVTSFLYWLLVILCGLQTGVFAYNGLYPIAAAKLIGFVLSILSFRAWNQQLHKDVEFYGWALGNYSKKVPLYEMLQRFSRKNRDDGKEVSPSIVVVADWLKNRPSITFWLILMITLAWLREWIPTMSSGCELVIYIIAFILSFPSTTVIYIWKCMKQKKWNVLLAILYAFVVFMFLFILPRWIINYCRTTESLLSNDFWPQFITLLPIVESNDLSANNRSMNSFLIIVIIAIIIVAVLFIFAQWNSKKTQNNDNAMLQMIMQKLSSSEDTSVLFLDCFKHLSGDGQKRFIQFLLADPNSIIRLKISADDISKIISHSKNNEACELAQELYNVNIKNR